MVLCDEIWTVGSQPVLCAARSVCWRAVLLEDDRWAAGDCSLRKYFKAVSYTHLTLPTKRIV